MNAKRIVRRGNDICLKLGRVVVVSYPKSGRTWLRLMINDMNIFPRFDHSSSKIARGRNPRNVCEGMERYFGNRVVFLMRDPRDVVVSYFLQASASRKGEYDGELKEFIRHPVYGFEKILAFNQGWCRARDAFRGFLAVSYEDMQRDAVTSVRSIVSFMGIPFVSEAAIRDAVARNDFNVMKRREATGELFRRYGEMFSDGSGNDDESFKVRKGKIGGYIEYMDEEDQQYCNELIAAYRYNDTLAQTGNQPLPEYVYRDRSPKRRISM